MKTQDVVGDKYKALEKVYRNKFESNKYLIIRLDGKAFHSFTKGMKKPFDERLYEILKETLKYWCENVDGVKIGYYQSDEISLVLFNDGPKINKQYWFDNKVEKSLLLLLLSVLLNLILNIINSVNSAQKNLASLMQEAL